MTNLLQKHWEWQENRRPMLRHGSVVRLTMLSRAVWFAQQCMWQTWTSRRRSTRPDQSSKDYGGSEDPCMDNCCPLAARWPIWRDKPCSSAWRASSHSTDVFAKVAPRLWLKMAMQILANVEEEWARRRHTRFAVSWADTLWIRPNQRFTL